MLIIGSTPSHDVSSIMKGLLEGAAFKPYLEFIESFDIRSVETAAELVKKWCSLYSHHA